MARCISPLTVRRNLRYRGVYVSSFCAHFGEGVLELRAMVVMI